MFTTSVPVTGPGFVDRDPELRRLTKLVENLRAGTPQWMAVLGPRKIGKTSLLLEAARRSPNPCFHFVTIDAFEVFPASVEIVRRYAIKTADAVFGTETGTSLEALIGRPSEYRAVLQRSKAFSRLPAEIRVLLLEIPESPADAATLRRWLDLPEKLCREFSRNLVCVWDEFQELLRLPSGRKMIDFPPLLRSVWQHHQRVAYVISGSARTTLTELVTAQNSPFFQHFTVIELGPFPREESVRLLVEGTSPRQLIPPSLAERAHEVLGGHPFYLQVLGEALAGGSGDLSLKTALTEILFSRSGRLGLYFENEFQRLVGRATTLAATLQALAPGPRRLTEVAEMIGASSGSTAQYIERLSDAVRRDETGFYHLADPAFALWLQWREPGGTVVPMKVLGDEAELRVAEELARMGFELVYQSRASRGAFDLLAIRGMHQLGIQVKRTHLPVRFDAAGWQRMSAEAQRLGWRWVIAVHETSERGLVHFLDPARGKRPRGVALDRDAAIPNLLAWLDDEGSPKREPHRRSKGRTAK